MTKLKNVEKDVKEILDAIESTRGDDMLLYWYYCQKRGIIGPAQFMDLFVNSNFRVEHNVSVFESVSRARRKLQSDYPDLRPAKEIQDGRELREEEYIEYARS